MYRCQRCSCWTHLAMVNWWEMFALNYLRRKLRNWLRFRIRTWAKTSYDACDGRIQEWRVVKGIEVEYSWIRSLFHPVMLRHFIEVSCITMSDNVWTCSLSSWVKSKWSVCTDMSVSCLEILPPLHRTLASAVCVYGYCFSGKSSKGHLLVSWLIRTGKVVSIDRRTFSIRQPHDQLRDKHLGKFSTAYVLWGMTAKVSHLFAWSQEHDLEEGELVPLPLSWLTTHSIVLALNAVLGRCLLLPCSWRDKPLFL